jgi:hypothetical protein
MKSWLPVLVLAQTALAVLAAGGALQIGCTACRTNANPTPTQRLEAALKRRETAKQSGGLPKTAPALPLQCPPLNAALISSTPATNGGHRVTLSWKASPPADAKHAGAVGYCIYRGAPDDPNPGLINPTPFPGTSCVDDLVANGQRYSYVVRAISADRLVSITSNQAPVEIPATGRSAPSTTSLPLCRGSAVAIGSSAVK